MYRRKKPKVSQTRHIYVEDKIDQPNMRRIVTVSVPLEYPGLTEVERRKMYEALTMLRDVFETADRRIQRRSNR